MQQNYDYIRSSELLARYQQGERSFQNIHLSDAGQGRLRGASLPGLEIRQAEFSEVNLDGANLDQAILSMIEFRACSLKRLRLNRADLSEINLQGQNLEQGQFQGARLHHAQLQRVNLRGATLMEADLTAANLRGANLSGADLRKADLTRTNLEEIQFDEATLWPAKSKFRGATFSEGNTIPVLVGQAGHGPSETSSSPDALVVVRGVTLDMTQSQARMALLKALSGRADQAEFRKRVLGAFRGRCAVTGCDLEQCLQAAHIVPFFFARNKRLPDLEKLSSNGILLRSDLHALFDWNLLTIDPDTLLLSLDPSVAASPLYSHFQQTRITEPAFSSRTMEKWIENLRWRATSYHDYLP